MCILESSKVPSYEFLHDYIKNKYGNKSRLPYRGKFRRGKVTKFFPSDENFSRRKISPTKNFPRRIILPDELLISKMSKITE